MKCPDCNHEAIEHVFVCNYSNCGCINSEAEIYLTLLTEAKQVLTENMIDEGCTCEFCERARNFIKKLEDSTTNEA